MKALSRYRLAFLFVAAAFAAVAFYYTRLPEGIAVHWDLYGTAKVWVPKQEGALALPLITLIVIGFLVATAPKTAEESDSNFLPRYYPKLVAAIAAFLLYVTIMVISVGAGIKLSVPSYISVGLGILIIAIGNALGKTTSNRIVGIRTPWTLASEEVWFRTHRFGGWLFVLAGLAMIIAGLLGYGLVFSVFAVIGIALVSTVYSFVISRLDRGKRRASQ
jgi:uncharacterized membrane protein